jgi:hypothetical protein
MIEGKEKAPNTLSVGGVIYSGLHFVLLGLGRLFLPAELNYI